jgi:hypothetical protein
MKSTWNSSRRIRSEVMPFVEFTIVRMTFGRRLELMKLVRDLAARIEYFDAGREEKNRMEASLLSAEIDRLYIEWGLEEIRGLDLDGEPANPQSLVEKGPEDLFREILGAVKAECGLNESERKN